MPSAEGDTGFPNRMRKIAIWEKREPLWLRVFFETSQVRVHVT